MNPEDIARQRLLEIGATVASLAPEVRAVDRERGFKGAGGEFGAGFECRVLRV